MANTILRDRLLKESPGSVDLVAHYIEKHAPPKEGTLEPVILPREVFNAFVLVALVGMEYIDIDREFEI